MSECKPCDKTAAEQLLKARNNGIDWAKKQGFSEVVIYKTVNGFPAFCAQGDEKLTRLATVEVVPIHQ